MNPMFLRSSVIATRAASLVRSLCTAPAVEEMSELLTKGVDRRPRNKEIYRKLSALPATGGTVEQTLNHFIREGKAVLKYELDSCVKQLRRYRRYEDALQIVEWMEKRNINFSHSDMAIHLDLISKAKGIAAAESYFDGLRHSDKNKYTYGALLNCYCVEQMAGKALSLFEKMDELNLVSSSSLAFNNLMSLYARLKQHEKVPGLIEEMKKRNVPLSTFSYNIWMQSYSCMNKIEEVEKVYEQIMDEKDIHWTIYSNLASIYVKAGLREKAAAALKKLEEVMGPRNLDAYHYLITLNSGLSRVDEVHRIWNTLKSTFGAATTNKTYLLVIGALAKLDDIDGLKKCFEEWEAGCSSYDMRLANTAVAAYLKHGRVEEAKTVLNRAIEKTQVRSSTTWELFMIFYLKNRQLASAIKCMEAAVSVADKKEWRPDDQTIQKLIEYFKEEKDADGAEEFRRALEKTCLDPVARKALLMIDEAAGKTSLRMEN